MKRKLVPPAPLFPLAVCLIVGIVVGTQLHIGLPLPLLLAGVVLATLGLGRWPVAQSIGIGLCFVVMGLMLAPHGERRTYGRAKTENVDTPTGRLQHWAIQERQQLLDRYRALSGDDSDAYAVLAAMTLGDKSALTPQLRHTYAATGASHVLALSGLHLSIIYMLLVGLALGRRRLWLVQVSVVLAIWAFALLTGLSTSVVRSATMISIYALFSLGGRRGASVNVLSFTAIAMLVVSPRSLFDVGFQLSFMAVLSILLFKPVFERYVSAQWLLAHPMVRWLWNLATVSVAAQLGVAPLIAYYFHYFSTWLLLTNLVVVPAATIILYGALLTLVVPVLGTVLMWVVGALNTVLGRLSQLPLASIGGLHPSGVQVAMLYVLVVALWLLLATCSPTNAEYRSDWPQS